MNIRTEAVIISFGSVKGLCIHIRN